jgi:hypothetical protein
MADSIRGPRSHGRPVPPPRSRPAQRGTGPPPTGETPGSTRDSIAVPPRWPPLTRPQWLPPTRRAAVGLPRFSARFAVNHPPGLDLFRGAPPPRTHQRCLTLTRHWVNVKQIPAESRGSAPLLRPLPARRTHSRNGIVPPRGRLHRPSLGRTRPAVGHWSISTPRGDRALNPARPKPISSSPVRGSPVHGCGPSDCSISGPRSDWHQPRLVPDKTGSRQERSARPSRRRCRVPLLPQSCGTLGRVVGWAGSSAENARLREKVVRPVAPDCL